MTNANFSPQLGTLFLRKPYVQRILTLSRLYADTFSMPVMHMVKISKYTLAFFPKFSQFRPILYIYFDHECYIPFLIAHFSI